MIGNYNTLTDTRNEPTDTHNALIDTHNAPTDTHNALIDTTLTTLFHLANTPKRRFRLPPFHFIILCLPQKDLSSF